MSVTDIRPKEDIARFIEVLDSDDTLQVSNWRHKRKNGEIFEIDAFSRAFVFEGTPARLAVAIDVTKRNAMELQLRQAQKMEAIGQLTGGVAHDFNNLLAVIQGNVELVKERVTAQSLVEMIDDVLKAAERGASLTHRLLAYSRQQPLEPRILNVGTIISDLISLLRRTIGEAIDIKLRTAPELPEVSIDPHELANAILNLAVNARDAMPDGGTLIIEGSSTMLDEEYCTLHPDAEPGRYALLTVSDSGTGMPKEILDRAFEPFFTTKAMGRGTGLGLSMVYGFVKQSGGHIAIYSELGHGTTIKMYLPEAKAGTAPAAIQPPAAAPQRNTGENVVLIVEDDEDVRRLTVRFLADLGYPSIEAADGVEALRILDEAGRIDLLLTDLILPKGTNGAQLAKAARARRPGLKVVYMSGYTRDTILHNDMAEDSLHLLTKPFHKLELAEMLHEVLDGKSQ